MGCTVMNGNYGINSEVGSAPVISYNNVWGNVLGNYNGCGPGIGDISADPIFVSGPLGDFYLSHLDTGQFINSPCVDAGNSSETPMGTTRTDHVPDTDIPDVGYHYLP